jgi:translation initiation factor IF-3
LLLAAAYAGRETRAPQNREYRKDNAFYDCIVVDLSGETTDLLRLPSGIAGDAHSSGPSRISKVSRKSSSANSSSRNIESQQLKETRPIRRPIRTAQPAPREGPRINEEIRVREVQLIDKDGGNKGVTEINAALAMAREAGLDLVEIAPNSSPPVAKILDFGKYKYQAQKKAAEARKKQKVVEIKEIKLRPMIDDHDYDVKMRSMQRFFEEGDKVKVTLRFRGREMAHQELGYKLLDRVKGDTSKIAKIEQEPRFEGRQVVMVLAPR